MPRKSRKQHKVEAQNIDGNYKSKNREWAWKLHPPHLGFCSILQEIWRFIHKNKEEKKKKGIWNRKLLSWDQKWKFGWIQRNSSEMVKKVSPCLWDLVWLSGEKLRRNREIKIQPNRRFVCVFRFILFFIYIFSRQIWKWRKWGDLGHVWASFGQCFFKNHCFA